MNKNLLITVSGGRSSAFMARHIQTSEKYKDLKKLYVFCNTGQERPETIQFLKNIVEHWGIPLNLIEGKYSQEKGVGVKHNLVGFHNLDMTGRPYKEAIQQMNKNKIVGVPCSVVPYCSEYLKIRPAHSFAKEIFGTVNYIKAIGYRREDLYSRTSMTEIKANKKIIAPLITDFHEPIGNPELNDFYNDNPFQLGIHNKLGNCELCWKKSDRNLIEAIQYGTRFIEWHQEQEQTYGNMFFRDRKSIMDLVALAQQGEQLDLFDDTNGDGCVCEF